jgi:adenylosuccinate lyase
LKDTIRLIDKLVINEENISRNLKLVTSKLLSDIIVYDDENQRGQGEIYDFSQFTGQSGR